MPHYENMPFEIPDNWVWTTVNDISKSIIYGVSESAKSEGKYKLLRITDIQNNKVDWETVPFTDFDDDKVASYILYDGDIVFARTGATVGKSYLIKGLNQKVIYASYLIRVQTSDLILPEYVKLFFESGYYWEQIELNSVGIGQPNVNGTILGSLNIPLPPFAEQKRIVIEIGRWLSLIDQIEDGKDNLQSTLKQTKSKILDLAIHGCLVPQDPNDEPAIELLKRTNPNFTPCDNAHYPQLPKSWCLVQLQDLCSLYDGEKRSNHILPYIDVKYLRGGKSAEMVASGKFVKKGSLLILVDGENSGEVFLSSCDGYQGSTFKQLKINNNVYEEYVLLVIQMSRKMLRENKVGSAIPHLDKKIFRAIQVCLPPYQEQIRIVEEVAKLNRLLDTILESL